MSGVLGAFETIDALVDLGNLEDDMQAAVMAGAQVVYDAAKAKCKSTSVSAAIREPVKDETSKRPAAVVSVTHARAAVEEFGTGPRAGARGPHNTAARPFMRPAADEHKPKVLNEIVGKLKGSFEAKGAST